MFKFNVGDRVWFINDNCPISGIIKRRTRIDCGESDDNVTTDITYEIEFHFECKWVSKKEISIAASPAELTEKFVDMLKFAEEEVENV